jgi:hypothetical protein
MNQNQKDGELVVLETPVSEPNTQALEVKSTFDIRPQAFQAGLDRRKKNRKALITWIQEELVEGTDWGRIHVVKKEQCPDGKYCQNPYHFSKPSLWKAGAEKIVGMMGLKATWPNLGRYEDLVLEGKSIDQLLVRCELVNDAGMTVSTGIGARSLQADYGDLNKAFKMAKKSSLVDAVLNCAGLSEIFTQDVEDMDATKIDPGAQDPFNPQAEPAAEHFPVRNQKPVATHCPIGKEWKGQPWELVDEGFLDWIIERIDDKPDIVEAARAEKVRRYPEAAAAVNERHEKNNTRLSTGKKLADYAREIAEATNIDQIIAIKEELPNDFEPGLRNYIATREAELGPR